MHLRILSGRSLQGEAQNTDSNGPGQYDWIVQTYEFDLRSSNVFFMGLNFAGVNTGVTSHYFNISDGTPRSTSAAGPPSTPTSTVAAVSTTDQSAGLGSVAKVGLGVGLGLRIPLFMLLGILIDRQLARARCQHQDVANPPVYRGETSSTGSKLGP